MSSRSALDEATLGVLQRLERIEALLEKLLDRPTPKVLYDVDDLQKQGMGRDEAYTVLRRYCRKTAGRRLRVTHEQLMDYYSGREGSDGETAR